MTQKRQRPREWKDLPDAPAFTEAEAHAVRSVREGTANPQQQKLAFSWIVTQACGLERDPQTPGDPGTTQYLVGRQSAGRIVMDVANARVATHD